MKIESINFTESYDALEKKINYAKQVRKFITVTCFRHHGFAEAKKFVNDTANEFNVYKVNLIISYINNLIEAGIKVIEYGHTNAEFIEDCMKFAAFVLLTNYTSNAQEHIHKDTTKAHGVWVVKFLAKANTLKGVRHRVEALTSSTCNLLKIICKARLNRQVLIFMQFFKDFVENSYYPDAGSYIEAFSKDFDSLFKIHSFAVHRPHLQSDTKKKIIAIRDK